MKFPHPVLLVLPVQPVLLVVLVVLLALLALLLLVLLVPEKTRLVVFLVNLGRKSVETY